MTCLFDYTPTAPDWRLAWEEMDREYPWIRDMEGCAQDPEYHAEGDVWVHTRMVVEELLALDAWRALPAEDRRVLFAAAVLHDVAKPECSRLEDGRIRTRGHSRRGAILARGILWEQSAPFALRERVAGLIGVHQLPYYFIDRPDLERQAIDASYRARADHLAILAEADVRGRVCADQQRLLDNVALFREQMGELGSYQSPQAFASDHARVLYFLEEGRRQDTPAFFRPKSEVVLMSGLPGAGKDHYVKTRLSDREMISLDELRVEMDVKPGDEQGEVIQRAKGRARELLRAGLPFVWNATNIGRMQRGPLLELFVAYQAHVRIVYVEPPHHLLFAQNRQRSSPVPEGVIRRFLSRWEVPDLREAHAVEFVVREEG